MKCRRILPLLLAILFFLPACSILPRKTTAPGSPTAAPKPRRVGSVAYVDEERRFVLVDTGTLYTPSPGKALKTFDGMQETGVLTVSPERRRPYVAADIVGGAPAKGNDVVE